MAPRVLPIVCPYESAGRVLVYAVDAPCPTLIDTGGAAHPAGPISAALRERGTELAAIQAVINTHGHWDHAGGNAAVSDASGAGILIHELGAPLLLDHRSISTATWPRRRGRSNSRRSSRPCARPSRRWSGRRRCRTAC